MDGILDGTAELQPDARQVNCLRPGLLLLESARNEPFQVGGSVWLPLVEEVVLAPDDAYAIRTLGWIVPVHRDGGGVSRRLAGEEPAVESGTGAEEELVA